MLAQSPRKSGRAKQTLLTMAAVPNGLSLPIFRGSTYAPAEFRHLPSRTVATVPIGRQVLLACARPHACHNLDHRDGMRRCARKSLGHTAQVPSQTPTASRRLCDGALRLASTSSGPFQFDAFVERHITRASAARNARDRSGEIASKSLFRADERAAFPFAPEFPGVV